MQKKFKIGSDAKKEGGHKKGGMRYFWKGKKAWQ